MDANGITICSITDNFDRDGQYTTCSGWRNELNTNKVLLFFYIDK